MNKNTLQWGAVFDWDGVIVDSSSFHEKSWELTAREEGLSLPEGHFKKGFGMKNEVIIPTILKWADTPAEINRLAHKKEELYRELIRAEKIEPLPGVVIWLQRLRDAGIPCVVASSSERENIDYALESLGIAEYFAEITSGDEVVHGKPAPDVFLLASKKIQVPPERCVVFEDAHVGIEAAITAGMKVVAVTTTHPADTLADADIVVSQLDELVVDAVFNFD